MFLARRAAAWSAVTVNPKCAAGMYLPFCSGEILPVANVAGGPFFAYYLGGPFLLLFTIIHPPVFWGASAELGHSGQIGAASVSRLPLRRGGRRPPPAGPWPNQRRGGDAPRERRPGLIGARTGAGRAELGRSGWNRAASVSRLPLRRGGRRPPPAGPWPNPRRGGDAPRDTRPGLIGARTAAGRAELGRTGWNRAASVSRLPLRRGGRRPPPAGPWPNPRRDGDAPRERRPGLIGARTAAGRAELGRSGFK